MLKFYMQDKRRSIMLGSALSIDKEIRIAKTFALIIGTLIVCWTPLTILFMIVYSTKDRHFFYDNAWLYAFFNFSFTAPLVNSAINPFIYAYRIKDVRESLKNMFKCTSRNDANDMNQN